MPGHGVFHSVNFGPDVIKGAGELELEVDVVEADVEDDGSEGVIVDGGIAVEPFGLVVDAFQPLLESVEVTHL